MASSSGASQNKQVLEVNKPSTLRWHSRLGHLTLPIVKSALRNNELPFVNDDSVGSVCDSFFCVCETVCNSCAKGHQLPFFSSDKIVNLLLLY